jgi:uncharacterized protein
MDMEELVAMELVDVRIDQSTNNPVVILRAASDALRLAERPTVLPIFIGNIEAQAIRIGLEKRATPRPMTHDLLASLISAAGAEVDAIVVTETRDNIFYAEIRMTVTSPGGAETRVVSARPSDAIALAVRISAPLFVRADLLTEQGLVEPATAEDGDPDEIVDQFRQFLDDINPDDFNG